MANTMRCLGRDIEGIVECHSNCTSDYMGYCFVLSWDALARLLDRIRQLGFHVLLLLFHPSSLLRVLAALMVEAVVYASSRNAKPPLRPLYLLVKKSLSR